MCPTSCTPWSSRLNRWTAAIPSSTATSEPGTTGTHSFEHDHEREREEADEQRQTARVAQFREQAPELLEEVARGFRDPEQLGQLPDDDRQGQPDNEPLQHGLGDEVREEAETEQPGDEGDDPDDQPERGCERDELVGPLRGEIADCRRRKGGRRRHRPRDEMPRAAERCVEDERARRRVEAHHRRDARDGGVGQSLRYEHGPDRQAGNEVATDPARPVTGQRREDGDPHRGEAATGGRGSVTPSRRPAEAAPRGRTTPAIARDSAAGEQLPLRSLELFG